MPVWNSALYTNKPADVIKQAIIQSIPPRTSLIRQRTQLTTTATTQVAATKRHYWLRDRGGRSCAFHPLLGGDHLT